MLNENFKYKAPDFIIKTINSLRNEDKYTPVIKNILNNIKISIENGESFFKNVKSKKFDIVFDNKILTIPLYTKKQCHLFLNSDNYIRKNHRTTNRDFLDFGEAIIYSWVLSNNGSYELFDHIIKCGRLKKGLIIEKSNKCKYEIIKWFCKIQKQLNVNNYNNIHELVDYLIYKFTEVPLFSFKGRTYNSVYDNMENWHNQLSIEKYSEYLKIWNHHPKIQDFVNDEYSITEILNITELYEEGKELQHCVLSYIEKIHSEKTTIWSLKMNNQRLLTVEINAQKNIVQIRGYKNRLPTLQEMLILDEWFTKENLTKIEGNMGGF